jgi:serine/threonine-protein kinase HipA
MAARTKAADQRLEVWLDHSDLVSEPTKIGNLVHNKGLVRFRYDDRWLKNPLAFEIDPQLTLDSQDFFPNQNTGSFGVFLDSSPDRWGQELMKRREALDAKDNGRKPAVLYAWDFLLGVQDATRMGALRFKLSGADHYLAQHALPAPPIANLAELAEIAGKLSGTAKSDTLDDLRRWLSVLVAPGASLGGARPKANITDTDKSYWIAKFPARNDSNDIGLFEFLVYQLARTAQIEIADSKIMQVGGDYHVFLTKRFDRLADGKRRYFASAMTCLKKEESEGSSYLDLAEFIQIKGDPAFIKPDLHQLFRRLVFNILVGNRDDHLRNHGFILTRKGWRLSPAYDLNPNPYKEDHVLNIDTDDNRPYVDTALACHDFYQLSQTEAERIVKELRGIVGTWERVAASIGLTANELLAIEGVIDPER